MITEAQHVEVPAPRTPAARPAVVPMTVRAAGPEQGEHPELVAARLVAQAATVAWVGRLALLVAVGLVALFVLLP
ncbi:hypothetical protein EV188_102490 [Actinomycetospora succinea]|uniref:Uncharacterized protein n=1 Tax=Actinomycetospora succinea TaxID=663603 RepID=A0A4R6VIA0_9PSEU|nr:hypothetical protein [Actinomycetospora succinea]TDQ62834.1 hypothetical protein EV188_102490 [Actinomycetospora succinea]